MRKRLSEVLRQPFYLWLLGVYPILHLYSVNLGLVIDREVLISLVGILATTSIAFFLINILVQNRHKTACMLAVASVCFSLSGHLYVLVYIPKSLFVWTLMITIVSVFIIFGICSIGSKHALVHVTLVANLIVLVLLASPTFEVLSSLSTASSFIQPVLDNPDIAPNDLPKVEGSSTRPDIYYVIPDAYPSDAWLVDTMNYDNSEFTRALEERGFVVAGHAQSNYGSTLLSLSSILNMRYYDSNPTQLQDLDYLRLSIADNEVARQLQQLGYTYIQLLSGFLIPSSIADINRDFTPSGAVEIEVDQSDITTAVLKFNAAQTETTELLIDRRSSYKQSFMSLYLDSTLLRIVKSQLDKLLHRDEFTPYHVNAAERFLDTIENIESIAALPEATFTIVHLIKPHKPTVFTEQGEIIRRILEPGPEEWLGELRFINSKFLQMIDSILENSKHQPVILFQADHGSTYGNPKTNDNRSIHFDSYAAYYLPDGYSLDIPQPYTFINSFPLVLNEVFATDFELQDDRLIELLIGGKTPFEQVEVTDEFLNN